MARATPSAIQESAKIIGDGVSPFLMAFDGNVTAGNLVVIQVARYANGANTPFLAADCTKSAGTATLGTITLDQQADANGANPCQVATFSAPVTGDGSLTFAIALLSGAGYFVGTVGEYTDIDVSDTRVEDASNNSPGSTTPVLTGEATLTDAGLFVATVAIDSSNGAINPTPNNGFTARFAEGDATAHQCGAGSRLFAASGATQEGDWTINAAGLSAWAAVLVAYKGADTGGGSDVVLELGVGAAAVAGLAPSLEITGDVSLALGVGAASVAGHAAQFDNGDPAPTATGLDFPGVTGNTAADWLMFAWAKGGGGSGLTTTTPPLAIYPATLMWRYFPRNSSQSFYSGLFHSEDWANNAFEGSTYDYYGAHPYHNTDIIGDIDPLWEIAENAGDKVTYQNGDPATIAFGTYPPVGPSDDGWYTQVLTARLVGSDYEYTFYPQWPDTSTAKTIRVSNAAHGVAPHPILCVGDAPWNRGREIDKGIRRGFQFYDDFLVPTDIASELASPGSIRTPWFLKLNPTPTDISDESGNGNHPEWINSNRPALWTESAPVALALGVGAASIAGYAPSLEISNNTDLALGVGAVVLAAPAPALGITAHIGLALGVGAVAVAGPAPSLDITAHRSFALGLGAATLAGPAPLLEISGDLALALGVGAVRADGYAPTLISSLDIALALGVGAVAVDGPAPDFDASRDLFLALGMGAAVLEGRAPSLVVTGELALLVGVGAVVLTGYTLVLEDGSLPVYQHSPTRFTPTGGATCFAPRARATFFMPIPD